MTETAETEFTVLSIEGPDGPVFDNCSLDIGGVTVRFKNGRATIRAEDAPIVALCNKLTILGYDGPTAPAPPNMRAEFGQEPLRDPERFGLTRDAVAGLPVAATGPVA